MKPKRTFQHQNLAWARLRRGLVQTDLAKQVGVSTRSIKGYEGATYAPAAEPLLMIGKVLKFPEGFFFSDAIGDFTSAAVSFRAGSKMAARIRDMALGSAAVAIAFNREVERYFALPEAKLPDYSGRNPERAAELLRGRWELHSQPVGPLLPLLEEKGIRILSLPSDASEADTFSFWYGCKARIVMINRDSVLTEQTPQSFAEAYGFRVLETDQIATNPSVAFRVETFEPADGFTPSKAFATRLLWRDRDGNDQSKLLLAMPEPVLAVVLRGDTIAQIASSSSMSNLPDESTVRRPPRRRSANASSEPVPQQ